MRIHENTIVTRRVDVIEDGLAKRTIYGLNIFARNGISVPTAHDPGIVFLRGLSDRHVCSAHVGAIALYDLVGDPTEVFDPPDGRNPYIRTTIEYHDGFFDLNDSQYPPACFFPRITPSFWESDVSDGSGDMEYVIRCAGLAVYVGASDIAFHTMSESLKAPFPGETEWLRRTTEIYRLVLMIGHDGEYFHAYARNAGDFKMLELPMMEAEMSIRSSEWFQGHAAELTWDDMSMCLALDGLD